MNKKRCYPRYSYCICFVSSAILLVMAFAPLIFKTNDKLWVIRVWFFLMVFLSISMLVSGINHMQFFTIENEKIIIRNIFGKIEEIKFSDANIVVQSLNTYFSWVGSFPKKWICIYNKTSICEKFKCGCSNKRGKHRIQIIYSEDNYRLIKTFLPNDTKQI